MLVRLKKTRDGVVLTCVRDDGSTAIQRTRHGGFFALHDLMHYAVETTLGFDRAFFGLMGAGWDFSTFGERSDPRYLQMPAQASWAEHLVDAVSRGYRHDVVSDPDLLGLWAEEINEELLQTLARAGRPPCEIDAGQLASIAASFRDLSERWASVPVGDQLELVFPVSPDERSR